MRLKITHLFQKALTKLYIGYMELISKTSTITFENKASDEVLNQSIVGFWHGDSFTLNFILREYRHSSFPINIIVTKDSRGNFISNIVEHYGATPIRLPDGIYIKSYMESLYDTAKQKGALCIALDGPTGPYHIPKKLAFRLAKTAGKNIVVLDISYSKKICLTKRWDKYAIPLPFTKIHFKTTILGHTNYNEFKINHSN